MVAASKHLISADDEWSPLRSVIVGRAEHSAFPYEAAHMIAATMPHEHASEFRPFNAFPEEVITRAQWELDNFASLLERQGIRVCRPRKIDWLKVGGYTGAMPRDGLMTVGNALIEAPFAWACRRHEIQLGYSDILHELSGGGSSRIYRAPLIIGPDTLYDGVDVKAVAAYHGRADNLEGVQNGNGHGVNPGWAINNSRPAFDAADFMRFGKTVIGQLSNVTNCKGVQYLQAVVPEGYAVEILDTTDEHAMHIDATILPLRDGLLVYNPERVTEEALRRHAVFRDWELHAYPFVPQPREPPSPPMYMCSSWLALNALSIDERRIMVEENDVQFADWVRDKFGMEPIMCPFQNVNSIGGSFHCATVDLVRSA
ncbi:hypothetical protein DL765_006295 [Monosporascus sp. GIB2]|nr:hypothetical protein DL765_006295 [Monosporascus sp. GIB2]